MVILLASVAAVEVAAPVDVAAAAAVGDVAVVLWASPKAMRETIAGRGRDLGG